MVNKIAVSFMRNGRVLCKFFMHGACLKGSDCMFSHNWSDQASQVMLSSVQSAENL